MEGASKQAPATKVGMDATPAEEGSNWFVICAVPGDLDVLLPTDACGQALDADADDRGEPYIGTLCPGVICNEVLKVAVGEGGGIDGVSSEPPPPPPPPP